MKLLTTGFIQVYFVAVNTLFIAKEKYIPVLIIGFVISFIWSWNVKRISIGTLHDRVIYSIGAGFGSIAGLYSAKHLIYLMP